MLGFQGRELPAELVDLLGRGLSGVALYPRNFRGPHELLWLTTAIRKAASGRVLIGIDQEGGTKFSLGEPFTPWPSPSDLGLLGDPGTVEQIARATAVELRAIGINLNFAPMLDLATNPDSPVTSGRSFGSDPERVAQMGCAYLRGLQAEGILACAKHFPGHGDAAVDPHLDLPQFNGTRNRLMTRELVPFTAAIRAGVPLIMTAHILLPQIDPAAPASLSDEVLQTILRGELSFDGLILADDLGMGAIARNYGSAESAVRALRAGSDIVMLCHDWSAVAPALNAVARAIASGDCSDRGDRLDGRWLAQSRARIERLFQRLAELEKIEPPSLEIIGCDAHRRLAAAARKRIFGQDTSYK
jgi:beta-N-acetylhexosaminidase